VLYAREGGHVQGPAHVGTPSYDVPISFPHPVLMGDRSHADELSNLLAVCPPKLRKASQQHAGGGLPDYGDRAQKIFLDLPRGGLLISYPTSRSTSSICSLRDRMCSLNLSRGLTQPVEIQYRLDLG
jgi:hypothetical protein